MASLGRPAAWFAWWALTVACLTVDARAAELSVRQVVMLLNAADRAHPVDLSGRDLSELDLSGLDLRGANLRGAKLYGVDLTDTDLSGADLHGANLNRSTIIRAKFNGADLSDASMFLPACYSTMEATAAEAPSFAGANVSNARLYGHFGWSDWRRANLSGVHFELGGVQFLARGWTDLTKGRFDDADLRGADLTWVRMRFASLNRADLRGADLRHADLSRADLGGARLDGAQVAGADLDEASVVGASGFDRVVGFGEALNTQRIRR